MENRGAGRLSKALIRQFQGSWVRDLTPKIHDPWSNQGASEAKILQTTLCLTHISKPSPFHQRTGCPTRVLPLDLHSKLGQLGTLLWLWRVHRAKGKCPSEALSPRSGYVVPRTCPSTPNSLKPRSLLAFSEVHAPEGRVHCWGTHLRPKGVTEGWLSEWPRAWTCELGHHAFAGADWT